MAEVERHPRRWSTERAGGWVGGNGGRGREHGGEYRGRIGGGGRGEVRHGGGGDAARMRARGIARGPTRGMCVGRGWFQFILWVLPTRSSLSNPVGQSVRCSFALSVSLFFFSSGRSVPSFVFVFAPPPPATCRSPNTLLYVSPFFSSLSLSLLSCVSFYCNYVYIMCNPLARSASSNADIILKKKEGEKRKNSGLPDGSAPVFFDYFASTVFSRCNPRPPRAPTLRPSPVSPVNSPRGLRLLLEIEKIVAVICRRSLRAPTIVFVVRDR